jgi:hypothetical protein
MAEQIEAQAQPVVTRAEARTAGAKRYFSGQPCSNGHVAERWVSTGGCRECTRITANNLEYRQANRERYRLNTAAWRKANPERWRAYRSAYNAKNSEKIRLKKAAKYTTNAVENRKRAKAYYRANRAYALAFNAAYYKNSIEVVRAIRRNRRARKKLALGKITASDVTFLMGKQGTKCASAWCRVSLKSGYHVDHIMPLARGGSNERRNLQLLCVPCNLSKNAKHPIDFAQENGLLL